MNDINGEENTLYVCLGPTCKKNNNEKFSQALEKILQTKIDSPKDSDLIKLFTSSCMGQCSYGPNIKAGGKLYSKVDKDLLKRVLVTLTNKLKSNG
ncbi:MAG: (2Fe-2S) ferredoxin domain-containing protein [Cyanobacteriota bacterium]